jgi:26S proteasome regulatory subunit T2
VNLNEFVISKDELIGADIKAICTEAGLFVLGKRRMKVTMSDFRKAKEKVLCSTTQFILYRKKRDKQNGLYS